MSAKLLNVLGLVMALGMLTLFAVGCVLVYITGGA